MLFIDRGQVDVPKVFYSKRADTLNREIHDFFSRSENIQSQSRFSADLHFIHSPEIREPLFHLFHDNCAYCNQSLTEHSALISHHRPISEASDAKGRKASPEHYIWIAYDWDNLYPICEECNISKEARFPVKGNRGKRFMGVEELRATENSMLVDPCFDHPHKHFSYDQSGVCHGLTKEGQVTIEVLDLNRVRLIEDRRLITLKAMEAASYRNLQELATFVDDRAPFAPSTRSALLENIDPENLGRWNAQTSLPPYSQPWQEKDLHSFIEYYPAFATTLDISSLIEQMSYVPDSDDIDGANPPAEEWDEEIPQEWHERERSVELSEIRSFSIRDFKGIKSLSYEIPSASQLIEQASTLVVDQPDISDDEGFIKDDVFIPETPAMMLIGENATGKSTILEALSLALAGQTGVEKIARTQGLEAIDFIRRPRIGVHEEKIEKPNSAVIELSLLGSSEPIRLKIDANGFHADHDRLDGVLIGFGPRRFFPKDPGSRFPDTVIRRLRSLHDPLFVLDNPEAWLVELPQGDFDQVAAGLRELLMLDEQAEILRDHIPEKVTIEIEGAQVPLSEMSEGYKSVVATCLMMMRELMDDLRRKGGTKVGEEVSGALSTARGIVFIDEIETHLHPRWKMQLVTSLRRAFPHIQFIASTHDPLCLRGLFDGEVVILQREQIADQTGHRLLGDITALTEMPSIYGLRPDQFLSSEFFGLSSTVDPIIEKQFATYLAELRKPKNQRNKQIVDGYREHFQRKGMMGNDRREQLMYEAIDQYLAMEPTLKPGKRNALKKETMLKLKNLWTNSKSVNQG